MTSRNPFGLSYRALTILIEHIDNDSDFPFLLNDPPRAKCTQMLVEKGWLRFRNSRTTTITRRGHDQFLKAAEAWITMLTPAVPLSPDVKPAYIPAHDKTDIQQTQVAPKQPVAAGQNNSVSEERANAPA